MYSRGISLQKLVIVAPHRHADRAYAIKLNRLDAVEFSVAFVDAYCESKLDVLFDKIGSVVVDESFSEDDAFIR